MTWNHQDCAIYGFKPQIVREIFKLQQILIS